MANCKECNSKMVLMSGYAVLNQDAEPYESGEEKEIDLNLEDRYIHAHYCEKCNKLIELWEE